MDYIAGVLELLGAWLVGNKLKYGFCVSFVACLIWVWVGITRSTYGLLVVVIPALFINIRNFVHWSKASEKSRLHIKLIHRGNFRIYKLK